MQRWKVLFPASFLRWDFGKNPGNQVRCGFVHIWCVNFAYSVMENVRWTEQNLHCLKSYWYCFKKLRKKKYGWLIIILISGKICLPSVFKLRWPKINLLTAKIKPPCSCVIAQCLVLFMSSVSWSKKNLLCFIMAFLVMFSLSTAFNLIVSEIEIIMSKVKNCRERNWNCRKQIEIAVSKLN